LKDTLKNVEKYLDMSPKKAATSDTKKLIEAVEGGEI